jgi:hypothetical protein
LISLHFARRTFNPWAWIQNRFSQRRAGCWTARCRSPTRGRSKPIETDCSQRKIHIVAFVLKIRSPGFAGHSFVNPFKASWNCRWHFMLRCAWQGCYGSAQKQPLPFLLCQCSLRKSAASRNSRSRASSLRLFGQSKRMTIG